MTRFTSLLPLVSLIAGCVIDTTGDDTQCTGGKCDAGKDVNLPIASDLPDYCRSSEVFRIERPIASDHLVDGTYSYGFRFKAPASSDLPVFVYLPGGPGSGSMEMLPEMVPAGWGYLLTDPRGVGCNRLETTPQGATAGAYFRTQEIARDIVAAIRDRKLTNYVVYGISYGTLLGTTVAHDLAIEKGITQPRAVVLEGVLGRAFAPDFAGTEFLTQWDRVRAVLPADVVTELDTKAAPYGIDATGWSRALIALLPAGPGQTAGIVGGLSTTQPEATRQQMLPILMSVAADHPLTLSGEVELYREVACREIMDTVPANDLDVVFEHGKLVRNSAEEGTKCGDLHVTTPFDSAAQQFAAQTYYFIGDSDVATPAWQGAYHFDHHQGPAVRITTVNGGHNSLQFNQSACAPQLLTSIAGGGGDLATVLASCPMATHVDRK